MLSSKAAGIIPARYGSTRFPGKPLALIDGVPMIRRVYENARRAEHLDPVIVATDDDRIAGCIADFGGECIMTGTDIATGTERVAQAVADIDADIVINIQGDEPLVPPELLDRLVIEMQQCDDPVCTPVVKITDPVDLFDPNQARVVFDNNMRALYFTRSPIPFNRDSEVKEDWVHEAVYYKHVGIYCFRRDFLFKFVELPEGRLEKLEKLEQLRILENGYSIRCVETDYKPVCVDVPEDIKRVEEAIAST